MSNSPDQNPDDAECDEDGIARFMLYRDSSGRRWREPIPEQVRNEMRLLALTGALRGALNDAYAALAIVGTDLALHGGSDDREVLQRHWIDTAQTFRTQLGHVGEQAEKLSQAVKRLLNV